jgi:hypothetical protein
VEFDTLYFSVVKIKSEVWKMVTYNLMLKLKDVADYDEVRGTLLGMLGQIEGLTSVRVERNLLPRTHDLIMVAEFTDKDAQTSYMTDPKHLAVGEKINPLIENVALVCYEQ